MATNNKSGTKLGRDLYLRYLLEDGKRATILGVYAKHIRPLVEAEQFDSKAFAAAVGYCNKQNIPDDLLRYLLRAMLGHAVAVNKDERTIVQALGSLQTPKAQIERARRTGRDFRAKHRNCECAGSLAANFFFADVFGIELDLAPEEDAEA